MRPEIEQVELDRKIQTLADELEEYKENVMKWKRDNIQPGDIFKQIYLRDKYNV